MFSYTKSLIAVALALVAMLGAGLWLQARRSALRELTAQGAVLQSQLAGAQSYPGIIANYEKRLETEDCDIKAMTRKFVGHDYESPYFIKAVVNSATASEMAMTDASKQEQKIDLLPVRGQGQRASVITHEITLNGSYTGLVKFMQSLNTWKMGYRLEWLEIQPAQEGVNDGTIETQIGLSVFSLEQVDSPK